MDAVGTVEVYRQTLFMLVHIKLVFIYDGLSL